MAARKKKTTRKKKTAARTATRRTNGRASGAGASTPIDALRGRFEDRLDEVRARLRTFEKDWSKTVDNLVSRGRSAERDLRKRLDKVTKDLNKTPLVTRVKKSPAYKRVLNGDLLETVKGIDVEKRFKDLRREVKVVQEDLTDFFQNSASRVKKVVDLPSRTDFDRLNRKIEQLSTQVRSLESRKRK